VKPLIISLGHRYRSDDGVGPLTLDLLRQRLRDRVDCLENPGDVTRLLAAWQGVERVYLIDALDGSAGERGDILELDGLRQVLPAGAASTSSHGLNLAEAIELSKMLGSPPQRLTIYGIVAANFSPGQTLDPAVEAAAHAVAERIMVAIDGGTGTAIETAASNQPGKETACTNTH